MKVTRQYPKYNLGGLIGGPMTKGLTLKNLTMNSEEKYKDMAGAEGGINMHFQNRMNPFAGKGSAIRNEMKYLQNQKFISAADQERLDYLQNMKKHRTQKIGAGIAAGAAIGLGGAALAGKLGAGALKAKGGAGLFGKLKKGSKAMNLYNNLSGDQRDEIDKDLEEEMMYMDHAQGGRIRGRQKVMDPNKDGVIDERDLAILRAYLGGRIRK